MSQEQIDALTNENNVLINEKNDLKNQLNNYKDVIESLHANLEATKQMFNEALNASLQAKATNIVLQKKLDALRENIAVNSE